MEARAASCPGHLAERPPVIAAPLIRLTFRPRDPHFTTLLRAHPRRVHNRRGDKKLVLPCCVPGSWPPRSISILSETLYNDFLGFSWSWQFFSLYGVILIVGAYWIHQTNQTKSAANVYVQIDIKTYSPAPNRYTNSIYETIPDLSPPGFDKEQFKAFVRGQFFVLLWGDTT